MAEGVRLFARLRQMFPRQHEGPNWVSAATLVADYRLLWRPRKYPARNLTTAASREIIAARVSDPRVLTAVATWFDGGSPDWKFARFQIDGHADRSGTDAYNQRLSERRAQAVAEYLMARGVMPQQMAMRSFGESQPRVPTADGQRNDQNRRAEIMIRR